MKGFLLLTSSFLLISCAALPAVLPPADQTMTCPSPFLTEKTRFIHAIETRLSGETKAVLIGVTVVDPATGTLSCALVSAEGMTLFEAVRGPSGVNVSRALPPFDTADFARNMMDDIQLIFLKPSGSLVKKGFGAAGEAVCRLHKEGGGWIDVSQGRDGRIQVRRYSEGGRLKRSVILAGGAQNPYATIELQASELVNYTLMMTVIESEAVKDEPQLKE
jgi:hypothetical protein